MASKVEDQLTIEINVVMDKEYVAKNLEEIGDMYYEAAESLRDKGENE